ncbi:MAG: hypothetical protein PW788_12480 [Micavibrio sp.]|nr:hypothetical protein [Micavibrio sp.]
MKTARQYIYAFLVAALLVIQLAQAAHYRVHFQEPEYAGRTAQLAGAAKAHDGGEHAGPDDCQLCFFMKYLGFALLAVGFTLVRRRVWQDVARATLLFRRGITIRAYSARASPAAA